MRETNAFGSGVGTRPPFPAGADAGRSLREERRENERLENVDTGRRLRSVRGPLPSDVLHVPTATPPCACVETATHSSDA
jgi:hypothetical protein